MFTVAPGRLVVLGAKLVGGLSVFSVLSSVPVNVEEDSRPSGSLGRGVLDRLPLRRVGGARPSRDAKGLPAP